MTTTKIVKKGTSKKAVLAVGVGGGVGEEMRLDITCGGGRSPVIYGGQIEHEKIKYLERATGEFNIGINSITSPLHGMAHHLIFINTCFARP